MQKIRIIKEYGNKNLYYKQQYTKHIKKTITHLMAVQTQQMLIASRWNEILALTKISED
jgi:hypothetical protein